MDNLNYDRQNLTEEQQNQLLFMMLVQQHQQIAMMGMGKIKNPATDSVERDMNSARYAIDTLIMLQSFTKGNLSNEMKSYLNETLNNLRLNYADEMKKGDPEPSTASGESQSNDDSSGEGEDE